MTSVNVTGQNESAEPDGAAESIMPVGPVGSAEPVGPVGSAEPVEPPEPAKAPEPVGPPRSPIRMVSIDELKPSAARSHPEPNAKPATDFADNQRWHDILLGFIDDPRGSVAEAAELVEADVTSLIALLSRRRDAMADSWQAEKSSEAGAATEDLRLALRGYRDFARQIAASLKALS